MFWVLFISLVISDSRAQEECGKILASVNYAIEGAGDWIAPWVVSLGVYEGGVYKVQCTGSLVTPNIIVTAGHCLREAKSSGLWVVRAGVADMRLKRGVETGIKRISIHPEYNWPKMYYDIGVALLNQSLPLSGSISTLCLPDSPYDVTTIDNYGLTVQGWGNTLRGVAGENLTEIDITVRSRAECNYKFQSLNNYRRRTRIPQLVTEVMFCANNNVNDDVGTCYGDR